MEKTPMRPNRIALMVGHVLNTLVVRTPPGMDLITGVSHTSGYGSVNGGPAKHKRNRRYSIKHGFKAVKVRGRA